MDPVTERAPLRVCLVGCGHISSQHGPAWQRSADAELVAVCDVDRDRARRRAVEWGVERVYDDVRAMLEAERPDALDVVTRPETHTALVRLAAERGIHVLCQKPLAPTLEEAGAMVAACDKAGVRFMVAEMWRHLPWFRALRREIDAGAIGEPHYLRILGSRRAMQRQRPVDDRQPYFADMPRLIVYEMMIHWIDAARYLMGEIESVYARGRRLNGAIAGEDWALVALTHQRGATTAMDGSWGTTPEPPGTVREGDLLLEGSSGTLHVAPGAGEIRCTPLEGSTSILASIGDIGAAFQSAFDGCIADFASSVRSGRPFESSAADNLRTLAATLAAYESMESGQVATPRVISLT